MHAVVSPRSESERSPFGITTPPELPVVGPDGTLNLANRKLCKLSEKGKDTFATVKRLVISNNSFKQLDALVWFKECEEVNASHNDFMRLRCFATIGKTLTVLDVSSNRLASLDCLSSLKQLRSLNVSHNRIEYVPTLDHLPQLEEINLGSNHVKELPDLHKLTALRTLNLHGNEISSLEHVEKKLPHELRYLDIGENLIEDLCELHDLASFVELESISIINNPCVRGDGRKFSYRPFVYSCILNELRAVDDSDLSDQEMIKGEWLHTAGKTRGFRPGTGSHDDLCEYLARECPRELGEHQLENSFTEKLRKVVEKRREYMSSSHDESSLSLSLHTPISPAMRTARTPKSSEGRQTANRTTAKPRSIFESSGSDVEADRSMASDITSTTVVISKADPEKSSQEAATAGTVDRCAGVSPSSSTTTIVAEFDEDTHSQGPSDPEGQRRPHSDPVLSQRAYISSATPNRPHSEEPPTVRLTVAQRLMANMQRLTHQSQAKPIVPAAVPLTTAEGTMRGTPAETSENDQTDREEPTPMDDRKAREAATKVQAWWRGVLERRRHASRVVDLLRSQVSRLEAKVDDLTTQTSLLTKINEEQTKTILEWASPEKSSLMARLEKKQAGIESALDNRVEELERAVSALLRDQYNMVPTPTKLSYVRRSDSQAIISWENALPLSSTIQGYELFVNGESCGQITAPGRKAIVDMINPDEDLLVTIQAISSLGNGIRSAAAEVVIPKMSSDDKENVDASTVASK